MTLAETAIHPTAVVYPGADLGCGVEIGPYCVVESGAELADGCRLLPHAQILGRTILGKGCWVGSGSVIGGEPQDKSYDGELTKVVIGPGCRFHEHVTVQRATEGGETWLGADVMMMAGSHVGHNARLEQGVILVNGAAVGGHATVGENAILSQGSALHQFGRIGRLSLLGGGAMATRDIPPFSIAVGAYPIRWKAPNSIGLERAGIGSAERDAIRKALKLAFGGDSTPQKIAPQLVTSEFPLVQEIAHFILDSPRGLCAGPARL